MKCINCKNEISFNSLFNDYFKLFCNKCFSKINVNKTIEYIDNTINFNILIDDSTLEYELIDDNIYTLIDLIEFIGILKKRELEFTILFDSEIDLSFEDIVVNINVE